MMRCDTEDKFTKSALVDGIIIGRYLHACQDGMTRIEPYFAYNGTAILFTICQGVRDGGALPV